MNRDPQEEARDIKNKLVANVNKIAVIQINRMLVKRKRLIVRRLQKIVEATVRVKEEMETYEHNEQVKTIIENEIAEENQVENEINIFDQSTNIEEGNAISMEPSPANINRN